MTFLDKYFIVLIVFAGDLLCDQVDIRAGSPCTLTSSGSQGVCKLLSECDSARTAVIQHHQLPQTCSFQDTQPIVCCENEEKRKSGEISKIKCREYSSFADRSEITGNECGHVIIKRVVNGEVASKKEFAHMALLGFEQNPNDIRWLCGGSIISDYYILTAAHCMNAGKLSVPKYVKVGITSLNISEYEQIVEIDERLPHPDYKKQRNDIALVKLKKPIKLNVYARPACLYTDAKILEKEAIATGWGATESGSSSNELRKVTLNIVSYDVCNITYTPRLKEGIDAETQICAGGTGQKDTCNGDAGGPLQIYHTVDDIWCMYDIIGISSFGSKICGITHSVYTKVSHYIKWIEDIVWPES